MKTGKSNKIKWAQAVKPMRAVGTETVAKGTFASEATLHTRQQSSAAGASSCGVDTQDAASNMSRAAYNVYPPAGSSAYIRIRRHPTVRPGREHHGSLECRGLHLERSSARNAAGDHVARDTMPHAWFITPTRMPRSTPRDSALTASSICSPRRTLGGHSKASSRLHARHTRRAGTPPRRSLHTPSGPCAAHSRDHSHGICAYRSPPTAPAASTRRCAAALACSGRTPACTRPTRPTRRREACSTRRGRPSSEPARCLASGSPKPASQWACVLVRTWAG